ncbi:hypothetical protein BDW22DRAFT_1429684 [Trametopsis cervina]|nr:hypothetical protein BDW22DRAFT_1429684 [Trametopsis cervina]
MFSFTGRQRASPAATNTGLPGQNDGTGFALGASNAFGTAAAPPEAGWTYDSPVHLLSDLSSKPELLKLNPSGFSLNLAGTLSLFTMSPQTASSPFELRRKS